MIGRIAPERGELVEVSVTLASHGTPDCPPLMHRPYLVGGLAGMRVTGPAPGW